MASTLLAGRSAGPAVVRDGTLLSALFESLATLSMRVYARHSEAQIKPREDGIAVVPLVLLGP